MLCSYCLPMELGSKSSGVPWAHLDWQIPSVAQIFNALIPVFSGVEHPLDIGNVGRCRTQGGTMMSTAQSGANFLDRFIGDLKARLRRKSTRRELSRCLRFG
jgi:hypothetical protein